MDPSSRAAARRRKRRRRTASGIAIVLEVFAVIYIVAAAIYVTWGVLSLTIRHTFLFPASGPVGLQDGWFSVFHIGIILSVTVIVVPMLIHLAALAKGNMAATMTVIILIALFVGVHLFSLLAVGAGFGRANRPGHPNNPANSLIYCCAPDVFADALSQCDNVIPCVLPIDGFPEITVLPASSADLSVNFNYTLIFGFVIGFFILDAVVLTLTIIVNLRQGEQWKESAYKYVESRIKGWNMWPAQKQGIGTRQKFQQPYTSYVPAMGTKRKIQTSHVLLQQQPPLQAKVPFKLKDAPVSQGEAKDD